MFCYHCMTSLPDDKNSVCPVCGKSLRQETVSGKFLEPGTVLQSKFIVGHSIGAGGFGNTYIGWNRLLLQRVAIKEFYPEQYVLRKEDHKTVTVPEERLQAQFQRGLQQFLAEARSVAALQDIKGVVAISNFFEENGTGYIVMEYLEGMDVKNILQKSGSRKEYEWCRRVVLTVLDTLREIHKRGVLHRDIAPDNIFVTKDGVIKLIDFGAAKHASALADTHADIMLKVGYAPIEQYSRQASQGPYTDLYAVAALFYRMLTGQKPLPANQRLQEDSLIPPSEMGVLLPEKAELAIMVCLNVQPQFRLQTAEEFMEALDGKYFQPVYEPEWILPPVEDGKNLWKRIRSFPMAVKVTLCFSAICLLMLGIGAGVYIIGNKSSSVANVKSSVQAGKLKVEDYTGQDYEEVQHRLRQQGLENIGCCYELSDKEEGVILEQSLEAGALADLDAELLLTISGGEEKYTMPDFVNQTEANIVEYFTAKNFEVDISEDPYGIHKRRERAKNVSKVRQGKISVNYTFSENIIEGYCYEQSVTAGEQIDASKDVTFLISIGGEEKDFEVEVPNFVGMNQAEVEHTLQENHLTDIIQVQYTKSKEHDDIQESDCVVEQSVSAHEKVNLLKSGTVTVEVTLSSNRKDTKVQEE